MDVAVKTMLFQNTPPTAPSGHPPAVDKDHAGNYFKVCDRLQVLREAALCCSMAHPNVVATYHYKVRQGIHS